MSFQVDDFTQRAKDNDILGLQTASSDTQQLSLPNEPTAKKFRSIKVNIDTLKSNKIGLPVLFKQLSKFKFQKRGKKTSKYASYHHMQNLQDILEIYQSWYHTLNPRMKFESMIHNMNSSLGDSEPKRFLEGVILSDRQRRRDRLERKSAVQSEEPTDSIQIPQTRLQQGEDEEEEQIWPEMFGGEPAPAEVREDAFSDDDLYDNEEVRQMVSFSTILATSSQMPVQSQRKKPDGLNTDAGFGDFLSDDEQAFEEAQNDDDDTNLNFM